MGTDANIYAETWKDGEWHLATKDSRGEPKLLYDPGRDYLFFGLLAGVRDQTLDPIAPFRGWPKDLSSDLESYVTEGEREEFSASWLLLSELYGYDWEKGVLVEGWVPKSVAEAFGDGQQDFPKRWKGKAVKVPSYEKKRGTQRVTWLEPVASWGFPPKVWKTLASLGDPDEVRLVFFFY